MTAKEDATARDRGLRRVQAGSIAPDLTGEMRIDPRGNPLAWLRVRRDKSGRPLIDASQFEAGSRFARDFARARIGAVSSVSWEATGAPSGRRKAGGRVPATPGDAAVDARKRYAAAKAAVGPDFARLLEDVCCLEIGLGSAEKKYAWPPRTAKVVLQLALSALARHYGLIGEAA